MMSKLLPFILLSLLMMGYLKAQNPNPLAHTYSIVAYDPDTGEMGVAVQSHWFSVGTIVAWGEAGVGVVATQSFVNPAFGPVGLEMMRSGLSAPDALKGLIASDKGEAVRQLAILDAQGEVAVHTGSNCIEKAGHIKGEHFSVQANMMLNTKVWPAMAEAFEKSKGKPLAERLMLSLEAAEAVGGDIRGRQSAALLVVNAKNTGRPWLDRKVDLRIDDHTEPIQELRRLLKVQQAYEWMNKGDLAMEHNEVEAALKAYSTAGKMFPENLEMTFWHAVALVNAKKMAEAKPMFAEIFKKNENWRILLPRVHKAGLIQLDEAELKELMQLGK